MGLSLSWGKFGYFFLIFARGREYIVRQADLQYQQLVFIPVMLCMTTVS